jgi:hypothetical protein
VLPSGFLQPVARELKPSESYAVVSIRYEEGCRMTYSLEVLSGSLGELDENDVGDRHVDDLIDLRLLRF